MKFSAILRGLACAALFAVLTVCASAQTTPLPYYYSRSIGTSDSSTYFAIPSSVAIDNSGNVYVGDYYGDRAAKFNSAGIFQPIPFPTTGPVRGVAVDSAGYVYVVDNGANKIIKYTSTGAVAESFGPGVSLSGTSLNLPTNIALDGNGNLYVTDTNNNRVVEFKPNAVAQQIFGVGTLSGPRGVAPDGLGNLYVSDFGNNRVVEFNSSGGVVRTFGSYGTGNGQLNAPFGLALDKTGNVYVGDNNNRVVEFTSTGTFVQNIGPPSGDGQIVGPRGLAFDSNSNLYVANQGNNRVLEFTQSVFSGTITLEGLGTYTDTTGPDQNITFTFQLVGSGTRFVRKQVLTPAGTFAFADIPAGTYNVAIKGACWLTSVVTVAIGSRPVNINLTLTGSDLNNDDSVDSSDFGMLIGDYNSAGDKL